MRIVIEARILGTGTGRYAEELLSWLEKIDTENEYIVLASAKGFERWQPSAPNFRKMVCDIPFYGLSGQIKLARVLQSLQPDLVHYTFQFASFFYRKPFVMTLFDLTQLRFRNPSKGNPFLYSAKQWLLHKNIIWAARRARHIMTPTEFVKKDIVQYLGVAPEKVTTTYNAAFEEDAKQGSKEEPTQQLTNKQYILYVGTAHAHKNLDFLVDSFAQLLLSKPELYLVFAGRQDAIYQKFIERTKQKNISNIIFLGFVTDQQLAWLYKNTACYVFPSLSEGFGLPGLEAMTFGAPVVSSNATCLPEVYGEAAHYFDPTSIPDCATAITEVLATTSLRKRLVSNGYAQVKKYSWKKMASQTWQIYIDTLDK